MNQEQLAKVSNSDGFIAALDQSGGSTPKALKQYGIEENAYSTDEEMFSLVHDMRARIITAPCFNGEKILGAILFEKTMDGEIEGKPTSQYLWEELQIVPFLKIDKGLEDEVNGTQVMKAMPDLDDLLKRAVAAGIFGTKMRSVIGKANAEGIKAVTDQQFEVGKQIMSHGLVPIIEPEITINIADKKECETIMRDEIKAHLDALPSDAKVMLKLTLPEEANFYSDLIAHDKVVRVVALSGGYDLEEACKRLSENDGMIASFSRALTNDLRSDQNDEEFNKTLDTAITKIFKASVSGSAHSCAA